MFKESIIKRIYAAFILIVGLFIVTIMINKEGTKDIYLKLEGVANNSIPYVLSSNQFSIDLLHLDKSFKDFLSSNGRNEYEAIFNDNLNKTEATITKLSQQNTASSSLVLSQLQDYKALALQLIPTYKHLQLEREKIQKFNYQYQNLTSNLIFNLKDRVKEEGSISLKFTAKSFFIKFENMKKNTEEALLSNEIGFIEKKLAYNEKNSASLKKQYQTLKKKIPELNNTYFTQFKKVMTDNTAIDGLLNQYLYFLTTQSEFQSNVMKLTKLVEGTLNTLEDEREAALTHLDVDFKEAESTHSSINLRSYLLGTLAILLSSLIGWNITSNVKVPLRKISSALEALTKGDMTARIEVTKNNEFSQVSKHINSLSESLHGVLGNINQASSQLRKSTNLNHDHVNQSHKDIELQHEKAIQVAAAMTEMDHSVSEVAESAQSSLTKVMEVEAIVSESKVITNNNINTISALELQLNDSISAVNTMQNVSDNIGSIIDVIRNIADQTNLLALNAAIEAARAGDQGRGFAVVADEVRVLAQKTANSTSEIEAMINSLQSNAKQSSTVIQTCASNMSSSVELAEKTQAAITTIESMMYEISQMSSHIAQAASEQSNAASSISENIEEISHLAKNNSNNLTQITDVGTQLEELAAEQYQLVKRFNL